MNKRRTGFTMMELIIVIVILGIMTAAFVVNSAGASAKANAQSLSTTLEKINVAMQSYYSHTNSYPANLKWLVQKPTAEDAGFDALALAMEREERAVVARKWAGPYLDIDVSIDNPDCLLSPAGKGSICFGAIVSSNDEWQSSGEQPSGLFVDGTAAGEYSSGKKSFGRGDETNLYHALSISGVDREVASALFQMVNGMSLDELGGEGNLHTIGHDKKGTSVGKVGISSDSAYNASKRIMYVYRKPF